MKRATPESKDILNPAETIEYFGLSRRKFYSFAAIIEDREPPAVEKFFDGYGGLLFYDDKGMPLVAMHWEHRFNNMVDRYNTIYKIQMPNITPHVCRHTYCSNQAKSGMNRQLLQ